jgi:hypothetical protein
MLHRKSNSRAFKIYILWEITQCRPLEVNRRFGGTFWLYLSGRRIRALAIWFTLVSSLAYSSTLKIEVTRSSEMSVQFQRTTRSYIPEDRTLFYACYEYDLYETYSSAITPHLCEHHCVITQRLWSWASWASADSGSIRKVRSTQSAKFVSGLHCLEKKNAVLTESIKVDGSTSRSINKYTVNTCQDTVKIYHIN